MPCLATCTSGQTTIGTGCDPALLRNCVDHPADCTLFKKSNLFKLVRNWPLTLKYNKLLWNCRGVPYETTWFNKFFSVSQRLDFNLHIIVFANKLCLSICLYIYLHLLAFKLCFCWGSSPIFVDLRCNCSFFVPTQKTYFQRFYLHSRNRPKINAEKP